MIYGIKPAPDNVVMELGVGTGAITKYLQDVVPDDSSYLGIELDRELVRSLKQYLTGDRWFQKKAGEDAPRRRLSSTMGKGWKVRGGSETP